MAVEVGSAAVAMFPSMQGFGGKLQAGMSAPALKAGTVAGENAGRTFSSRFSAAAAAGGVLAGAAIAKGFQAAKTFLSEAKNEATDLGETVNKSNIIFGDSAKTVERWASTAYRSIGLSKAAALESAASFGDMFKQIGFTGKQATRMSKATVQMAGDLGSFNNLPTAEVADMISASFRGEFDSLQRVIPNINAARVEKEALAKTGKTLAKQLTAEDKATATLAIVQRDGARAAGDFARTSGGLANQQKIAAAQTDDLQAKVGTALLPAMTAGAVAINSQLLPALSALADEHGPRVSAWLEDMVPKVGAAFGKIGPFLDSVGPKLTALLDSIKGDTGSAQFSADISSVGDSVSKLGPLVGDAAQSVPSLSDVMSVASTTLGFFADHADLLAKAMPLLAAGFVAVKLAQAAANVAALVSVPVRIAEVAATRAHTKAMLANSGARATETASTAAAAAVQGTSTAATNAGVLASVRARVAAVASATAQKAIAIATGVWTAAQWVLNAALTANPIGLIVVGIAALIAVVVLIATKTTWFQTIWTTVWGGIQAAASAVGSWFTGTLWPSLQKAYDQGAAVVRTLWTIYKVVWSGIAKAVLFGVNLVVGYYKMLGRGVMAIVGFFSSMAAGVRAKITSVVQAAAHMGLSVINTVRSIPGKIASVGGDLVQGLANGITNAKDRVMAAVQGLVNKIPKKIRELLGIASPSKVTAELGKQIGQGMAVGMTSSTKDVVTAGGKMSDALRKVLVAKSPSRVMASEVGQYAGVVRSEMDRLAMVPRVSQATVRRPMAMAAAGAGPVSGGDTYYVTSNASDPHEVARRVAAENAWRKRA